MKKNDLTDEDFAALANAVAVLPFVQPNRSEADYILDLMETVINFHIRVEVVLSSLGYFRDHVQHQHRINTHEELKAVLAKLSDDEAGNKAGSQFLWGNFLWTRVALLRELIAFFESEGVTDQVSLYAWASRATFERDFKGKVKGLGIAVFHWLQIRCNVDSVKPDVHVLNFGKRVIGRRVSEKVLVKAISEIAPLVGQSMAAVDVTIWFWGRLRMTADMPGVRVIAWNMLKSKLDERLRGDVLSDHHWQLILDEPHLLHYDEAGLTLRSDRTLLEMTGSGSTIATIKQSTWTEGLLLVLKIELETPLPKMLFQQLQQRIETQGWQAANEPDFTASLDIETSMLMVEPMSHQALSDWVDEIIDGLIHGLENIRS